MATAIIRRSSFARVAKNQNRGFSLIEVVIAMAILTTGMISLLGVFGLAMASTQTSQADLIAKQLANEYYESIITARNSTAIGWDAVNNSGSTNCATGVASCGIFTVGLTPIYNSGADGIFGTSDDSAAGEQTLQDPGADGIYQTTDDVMIPLTAYQRSIVISPVYDSSGNLIYSIRSMNITIQYSTPQNKQKTYTLNSYISEFQ
jgi:prepilin-type N-terminal cleavage/methylation domain-containing protein